MFFTRMLPDDTRRHLRAACKEQLLAARSVLDNWIEDLEARRRAMVMEEPEPQTPPPPTPPRRRRGSPPEETGGVDIEAERMAAGE